MSLVCKGLLNILSTLSYPKNIFLTARKENSMFQTLLLLNFYFRYAFESDEATSRTIQYSVLGHKQNLFQMLY